MNTTLLIMAAGIDSRFGVAVNGARPREQRINKF